MGTSFEDGKSRFVDSSTSTVYTYEYSAISATASKTAAVWLCKRIVKATQTFRFANGISDFSAPAQLITVAQGLTATYPELEADDELLTGSAPEVQLSHLLQGELSQFNRLAGGAIVSAALVGADATVVSGPCVYYGAFCLATGTMAAIYDNTAASGTKLLDSQVGAANTFYGVPGVGIQCANGIYADYTSGSWLVLYVAGV